MTRAGTHRTVSWFALASLLAAAGSAASQEVQLGRHAGLPCRACHVTDAEGRPAAPAADEATSCARCHGRFLHEENGANHPSNFVPSRPLPTGFPLDAAGRMTCLTCHAMHNDHTALLRDGAKACTPCHAK